MTKETTETIVQVLRERREVLQAERIEALKMLNRIEGGIDEMSWLIDQAHLATDPMELPVVEPPSLDSRQGG